MNVKLMPYSCMVVLLMLISSCIREDLSDCPPKQYEVRLSVKDKNYTNIDNFPQIARMEESAPFSSFEGTIYYILRDSITGRVVKESSVETLSEGGQTYSLLLDNMADGVYTLTAWGNMTTDYPAGVLHQDGKEHTDIYMATRVLHLGHTYQTAELPLERMKGALLLICSNFPSVVTSIEQNVTHVYPQVDAARNYIGDAQIQKRTPFKPFTTLLLAPTSQPGANLKLRFYADKLDAETPFLELPEMDLAVRRNEISALSVDYKVTDGVWEIQAFIQGQWVTLHRLDIDN